jgi:hypothetical protein
MTKSRFVLTMAVVTFLVFLLPALALALTPKPGHYAQTKGGKFVGVGFDVTKSQRVKALQIYDKCAKVPLKTPTVKITKGSFSLHKTVKDVIGQTFDIDVTGKFVSKTKAMGTAKLTRTGSTRCVGKKISYTVKRQG